MVFSTSDWIQAAFAGIDGGSSLPRSKSRNVPRAMPPIMIFALMNSSTAKSAIIPVTPRSTKCKDANASAARPNVNAQ